MKKRVFFFIAFIVFASGCTQTESIKINGVSFVASPDSVAQRHIDPILDLGSNFAAVMPFGFVQSLEHPHIIYNSDRQWFGETLQGTSQYIKELHRNGIEVMLKPQIWIWRGEFTGYLNMNSEQEWSELETSYREFILTYAQVAESECVELFCIGTELEQFIVKRPKFWNGLIKEIRNIYTGKLTYAANWDEYKRVPFWKEVDFIGVDAYFPISPLKAPSMEIAKQGWKKWKEEMSGIAAQWNRPILFTEYGYRSVDYAGKEPWKSDRDMNSVNLEVQSSLLEALYQEVWQESWFAGGFLWKWHLAMDKVGGKDNHMFTPQNKPAQERIKYYYSQGLKK
jgi:hypothetical protein